MPLLDTATHTATRRYIARCSVKGCGSITSALAEVTVRTSTFGLPSGTGPLRRESTTRFVLHDTAPAGWSVQRNAPGGDLVPADPCGHRRMRVQGVRGTVTEKACDARCEGAKGPNCECSCGGANHGSAHA